MRISDWSSDVCSSDLKLRWLGNVSIASANLHWISAAGNGRELMLSADTGFNALQSREATADLCRRIDPAFRLPDDARHDFALDKLGRASCRERVGKYV